MTGFDKASQPRDLKVFTARFLSIAGHPFVLVPLTVALTSRRWRDAVVVAATSILPLLILIVRNVRRGTWSDADVSRREQRSSLYLASVPILILTGVALHLAGAHERIFRGFLAGVATLVIGFALTPLLKMSLHMAFAGFCAAILAWRGGFATFALIALAFFLVALAWSRRKLDRHTWAEITVGVLIGLAAGCWTVLA